MKQQLVWFVVGAVISSFFTLPLWLTGVLLIVGGGLVIWGRHEQRKRPRT